VIRRAISAIAVVAVLLGAGASRVAAGGNSPPIAVDDPDPACGGVPTPDTFPIPEDWHDWQVLAMACGPLENDREPDGDALRVDLVGQPAHGEAKVVTSAPLDWLAYRPAPDYSTPASDPVSDVITYRAFDGQAFSNEASYRIWIAPVNDPPTFTPGPALVEARVGGGPVSIPWATHVSPGPANEGDQHVSFEVHVTAPAGTFAVEPAIDADGTLTFTPGPDPWLAEVTVKAHDDGGLEDYLLPDGAPYDPPDDTSDAVSFRIAIEPPDTDPPVVDGLAARIARTSIGGGNVPVRVSWHATDAGSGVTGVTLRRRVDDGGWREVPVASPASSRAVVLLGVGTTNRLRVRASDGAGNASPLVAWPAITVLRPQEGSDEIAWTGLWRLDSDARFSGGRSARASEQGHASTFAFTGSDVAWVSRLSPHAGRAAVRIDGVRVATVDLSGPSAYRAIVFRRHLVRGPHTIEIRPLGDGRVDVDAFIVLR
jgi:hypothetical protein